jgi:hypothetical protein
MERVGEFLEFQTGLSGARFHFARERVGEFDCRSHQSILAPKRASLKPELQGRARNQEAPKGDGVPFGSVPDGAQRRMVLDETRLWKSPGGERWERRVRRWKPKWQSHPGCDSHRSQAGSLCHLPPPRR